jgi:chromosome segregation ATPase
MTTFSYLQKKIIFLMLCFFSLQAFYFLEAVGEGFAMIGTLEKALKLQVKKNKEQEQDFKQKIAVADSEIARLKISFQEKSAELDQSLEKNKSLSAENSLLSQSVAEEKAKIISLEREKQATQAQISALTSKNKQLLSQLDSLQKERSNDAKIFENLKAVKTRLDDMNVGFTEFSSLSLGIEQVVSSAEDLEKSYEEKNQD